MTKMMASGGCYDGKLLAGDSELSAVSSLRARWFAAMQQAGDGDSPNKSQGSYKYTEWRFGD